MSLQSRLLARMNRLPKAETRDIEITRNIEIKMSDGAVLLADRYAPRASDKPPPVLLVRSPYGRSSFVGSMFGELFAERGFQVLVQSCRGTFGSGGEFHSFVDERSDGLATIAWLKQQPWCVGKIGMLGPSYLGITQWAVAAEATDDVGAMAILVSASRPRDAVYQGGAFWLETALVWTYLFEKSTPSMLKTMWAMMRVRGRLRAAQDHLPIGTSDEKMIDHPAHVFRQWLCHDPESDPWWRQSDFSAGASQAKIPVHLVGGYYDVFAPQIVEDYARLRSAGASPHLTLGPWWHTHAEVTKVALPEALAWLRAHLLGDASGVRAAPVRAFVMGDEVWREFSDWPPPERVETSYYLHPERGLSTERAPESSPDRYTYDPADPTPSVGGTTLASQAGPKDNRALEQRSDVLVYSTPPLEQDLTAVGDVKAVVFVRSSLPHADFFVRLCDVWPNGKSMNLCDGLFRVAPGRAAPAQHGTLRLEIPLGPLGQTWKTGHRIRVQVSSGAHPRHARNLGSGEPAATGTTLVAAEQSVFHDPTHPSAIVLPIVR